MREIDFIKNCCEVAYGFEYMTTVVHFGKATVGAIIPIKDFEEMTPYVKMVYYPLLLQRAIEGVNASANKIISPTIEIHEAAISASVNGVLRFFRWGSESIIDHAKRSALEYVFDKKRIF